MRSFKLVRTDAADMAVSLYWIVEIIDVLKSAQQASVATTG